ncbi:hypothetical protein [Streptomyces sp. NPDC088246]|uniref:hypothetical protein n=1 Tax=Streptomyces sp. NPDC088246 TaxID=3365842 RepID=UPI0037F83FF9
MHKLTRTAAAAAMGVATALATTDVGAAVTVATASVAAASEVGAQGWDVAGSYGTQQECVAAGERASATGVGRSAGAHCSRPGGT